MNRTLVFLAMLAAAFFAAVVWIWPQYQDYAASSEDLLEKERTLQNLDRYASQLQSIQGELGMRAGELDKLDAAIPEAASLPALYHLVRQLAAESGLQLTAISSSVGGQAQGGTESRKSVSLGITLQGSYENLKAFLRNIQSTSRFFEVDIVQFAGGTENPDQFQFQLQATTYFF